MLVGVEGVAGSDARNCIAVGLRPRSLGFRLFIVVASAATLAAVNKCALPRSPVGMGCGARCSGRGRRCGGGGLDMDFVLHLRRRDGVRSAAGVGIVRRVQERALVAVGLAGDGRERWSLSTSVLGERKLAAGFASFPQRRWAESVDLELGDDRGVWPRPMRHKVVWLVSGESLLRSLKLRVSEEVVPSLGCRCVVSSSSGCCFGGSMVGRRATACCTEDPRGFVASSFSFGVLCVKVLRQLGFQRLPLFVYLYVYCMTLSFV